MDADPPPHGVKLARRNTGCDGPRGESDICAAGISTEKPLRETPIDLWRRAFAVNVEGVAVLGEMVKRKTGS